MRKMFSKNLFPLHRRLLAPKNPQVKWKSTQIEQIPNFSYAAMNNYSNNNNNNNNNNNKTSNLITPNIEIPLVNGHSSRQTNPILNKNDTKTSHGSILDVDPSGGPVTFEELKELIEMNQSGNLKTFTIVDVREVSEYADGSIPTAVNLPLNEFHDGLLSSTPRDKLALYLPEELFSKVYGFSKFPKDAHVSFDELVK
ncbi:hypothetical protein G9A89_015292 [Geosiphon pyriformis]|nr:hypothetical protein G9A89_015292 [Geosiphon pyriformis]